MKYAKKRFNKTIFLILILILVTLGLYANRSFFAHIQDYYLLNHTDGSAFDFSLLRTQVSYSEFDAQGHVISEKSINYTLLSAEEAKRFAKIIGKIENSHMISNPHPNWENYKAIRFYAADYTFYPSHYRMGTQIYATCDGSEQIYKELYLTLCSLR